MRLSTSAAGSGFVGWVQWFLHWINHRPNPWVLSLRWYVNVFLQTSIWETITVRIGLLSGNEKERKNMKLPSEPILFCPTSLTRTSCWNDDFPRGLHHSMSLLLEHYIFLKVSHVMLHSESRVLLKEKRAGGRKERHKVWQESPSETMKGDGQTWRADYRVSRTPLGLIHSQCLLPLIPQSLSPIHLPEGDKLSTAATAVAGSRRPLPSATEQLSS